MSAINDLYQSDSLGRAHRMFCYAEVSTKPQFNSLRG
jgi:hypothetical protein